MDTKRGKGRGTGHEIFSGLVGFGKRRSCGFAEYVGGLRLSWDFWLGVGRFLGVLAAHNTLTQRWINSHLVKMNYSIMHALVMVER